ncbi:MAG: Npun_F5749 family FMN-dependent PPOX-type flavoprotein [Cyanobacteria bacterium P01_A01_bin.17]
MTPPIPWRPTLARALHRNRSLPNARYLQLATLTRDRKPANRTVVFRGFLEASNQLKFVTDQRSAKVGQIQSCSWTEACWYFPKTREQFRISGQLRLIDRDCADESLQRQRQLTWKALSEAAQEQFAWPTPGMPPPENPAAIESPAVDRPLSSFCLVLLEPSRVDHLELRGMPQQRCLYHLESSGQWSVQSVNP